ncbi:hypothetical protein AXG93_1104s1070 [Marchantia polymorpha subsp. ruderalis]|uniref:Uncharacterized protein n=1 Tax=Marchantia polymorpha subsp. ruderalis TaxID=1480154 RepID=A0A176WMP4_MARPO|nr:hypothetical protein AXG93_1104s1070 [Marchantia polymorpha subsp. ruderalis]
MTEGTDGKPGTMISRVLAMIGGDGEDSYARNSSFQQEVISSADAVLATGIEQLTLPAPNTGPLVISDLGCSSGPNTVNIVSRLVKMLKSEYQRRGRDDYEFQAYFNDLPSTDFNFLFELLSSERREFFYAGVPGSFYERIFPKSSVNVFLSTNTLHWISQAPREVTDENSAAYNKGRIWLHGANEHVIDAYKRQGENDMRNFLDAKVQELVPGGLLYCIFGSARIENGDTREQYLAPFSEDETSTNVSFGRILEHVWDELIAEGLLTEEQRARCNLPWYKLSEEELRDILKSYEDVFKIVLLQNMEQPVCRTRDQQELDDLMRMARSIYAPFFNSFIGAESSAILFARWGERFGERIQNRTVSPSYCSHVLALLRL